MCCTAGCLMGDKAGLQDRVALFCADELDKFCHQVLFGTSSLTIPALFEHVSEPSSGPLMPTTDHLSICVWSCMNSDCAHSS